MKDGEGRKRGGEGDGEREGDENSKVTFEVSL